MEFKKVPKRTRQPQSNNPPPSHSRLIQTNAKQPIEQHSKPVMSGHSQKGTSAFAKPNPSPFLQFITSKKGAGFVAILVVVIVGGYVALKLDTKNGAENQSSKSTVEQTGGNTSTASNATTPTYDTVAPKGKTIEQLGGWKRVSPPSAAPVFAYSDKIGTVAINVSQQQLPESFESNTADKVAGVAKNFNATTTFDAGGTKVYIGTSAKGPQSVIFSADNLLILIKSEKNIDTKAWIDYINALI